MNIQISQEAKKQVVSLLQPEGKERFAGIRIGVDAGGCSGYKYSMNLVHVPDSNDLELENDGVKVFVDPTSAPLLDGLRLDYVSGLIESGFVFNNPNAKKSCGCGSSFGV